MWIKRRVFFRPAEDGSEGGAGGAPGEAVGTGNDARIALLNSINDSLDATRGEDFQSVNDDGTTEPFQAETKQEPQTDEQVVEGQQEEAAATPETPAAQEPQRVKLKVNGQELELTLDEVIARAQKVTAADEYLAQAKRQAQVQVPKEPEPSQEELQRLADEEDRKLVRAIQMGTEEEATAALRKIRSAAIRPSINTDDVTRAIDERLTFKQAVEKFNTEFSDIVSDPVLHGLALQRDRDLLASGDTRSYAERYTEIGTSIRKWKASLAPAATQAATPAPTLEDKTAKKQALPKAPTAVAAKAKPPVQQDEDNESTADIIASMAKSRGGPQWMRA